MNHSYLPGYEGEYIDDKPSDEVPCPHSPVVAYDLPPPCHVLDHKVEEYVNREPHLGKYDEGALIEDVIVYAEGPTAR